LNTETAPASSDAVLNFENYMVAAQKQTGLKDFGDLEFVQRAKRWLCCIASESKLNAQGRAGLEGLITNWMVNRLRFVDDLKRHPEILAEVIREPLFVTGMTRTGTTKLQRILASDPVVQSLPLWITLNMAPIPGADPRKPDPRIAIASGFIDQLLKVAPGFMAAHPAFVDEPEEECFWTETDFQSINNSTRFYTPSYWNQTKNNPNRESYPFLKRALQYVQWQRGEAGKRPWVLKSPLHFGNVATLFRTFPDATVVHSYRDPVATLPSDCRITEVYRGMSTDDIDLHKLGAGQFAVWAEMQQCHLQQREDPRVDERIIDVRYDDINQNVFAVIREIYQRRRMNLDAQTEQKMRDWEARHPQHQFGKHTYSLERYGLTKEAIQSAFSDYIKRFG
jgi:hypothetical protein